MSRSLDKAYPSLVPKEVFLSHSDQDCPFAADLADMMRRHGVPVWYSRTNIRGGQQWQTKSVLLSNVVTGSYSFCPRTP